MPMLQLRPLLAVLPPLVLPVLETTHRAAQRRGNRRHRLAARQPLERRPLQLDRIVRLLPAALLPLRHLLLLSQSRTCLTLLCLDCGMHSIRVGHQGAFGQQPTKGQSTFAAIAIANLARICLCWEPATPVAPTSCPFFMHRLLRLHS